MLGCVSPGTGTALVPPGAPQSSSALKVPNAGQFWGGAGGSKRFIVQLVSREFVWDVGILG